MEPINPETDGCPNYRKIVTQPMDLGTALNRLYLDYYQSLKQFWYELGLVFKNCRKYNKDENAELRILCDTLREVAVILYNQWYNRQKDEIIYLRMLKDDSPSEQLLDRTRMIIT